MLLSPIAKPVKGMRLHFFLRFYTTPGQQLSILGDIAELGAGNIAGAVAMQYLNGEFWQASIDVDVTKKITVHYKYVLTYADGYQVIEWEDNREVELSKTGVAEIQLVDTWNHAGDFENTFFTSPFQST
jgi:4-alpha-glucanotransferase